jgi:hypothetical protein
MNLNYHLLCLQRVQLLTRPQPLRQDSFHPAVVHWKKLCRDFAKRKRIDGSLCRGGPGCGPHFGGDNSSPFSNSVIPASKNSKEVGPNFDRAPHHLNGAMDFVLLGLAGEELFSSRLGNSNRTVVIGRANLACNGTLPANSKKVSRKQCAAVSESLSFALFLVKYSTLSLFIVSLEIDDAHTTPGYPVLNCTLVCIP